MTNRTEQSLLRLSAHETSHISIPLVQRSATLADLPPVHDLIQLCEAVDQLNDDIPAARIRDRIAGSAQLWFDDRDQLLGCGALKVFPATTMLEAMLFWYVHPQARTTQLAGAILTWASEAT